MRRLARDLGWAAIGLSVLGLCLRAADLRGVFPVAQALLPLFGLATVLLALVAVIVRRNWFALIAGALALTYLSIGALSLVPRTAEAGEDDLVVLSANVQYGRGDVAALARTADEADADVIVITEVTPNFLDRLEADGLSGRYPHRAGRAREGAGGTLVLARGELRVLDPDENELAFDQPTVEVHHAGKVVQVRAVHTFPPTLQGSRLWRRQLFWLERWRAEQHADRPLVMAGDFNASTAHPAFRDLKDGMDDAQQVAGQGWQLTWPTNRALPFVSLDHVLVRRLDVVDFGSTSIPGSDHRAVWARLRLQ